MRDRDSWRSEKDRFGRECLFVGLSLSILLFVALLLGVGVR